MNLEHCTTSAVAMSSSSEDVCHAGTTLSSVMTRGNQCTIIDDDKITISQEDTISQEEEDETGTAVTVIEHVNVDDTSFMSDVNHREEVITESQSPEESEEGGTITLAFTREDDVAKYNWHVENTDDIVVIQTSSSPHNEVDIQTDVCNTDTVQVINCDHITCHIGLEGEIPADVEGVVSDTFPPTMNPCPVPGCQWFLFSDSALKCHVARHGVEEDGGYRCTLCVDVYFDSSENLLRHCRHLHSTGVPSLDPVAPPGKYSLKVEIVDFYFILRRSSSTKNKKAKRTSRFYRCVFCSFGTPRKPGIVRHMTNLLVHDPKTLTHGVELSLGEDETLTKFSELSKISSTPEAPGKNLVCHECGKSFTKRYLFLRHMEVHSNTKLLCDICGKEFRRKRQLWKHQQVHTKPSNMDPDTKVWKCSECSFESKVNVEIHAHRQLHPTNKSVKCDVCDASFGDRPSMNKHRRRMHAADRPFPCPCTECHYRFAKLAALKSHMSQAHNFNGRYKCVICGYLFRWKAHVKRHLSKVHGKQSYDPFIVAVKNCPQVELKSHDNSSMITVMIDTRQ